MDKLDMEHYMEILNLFGTAMLVTRRNGELRSRPMAIAQVSNDGDIWFLTSIECGNLEEITDEPFVNLSMQDEVSYLSISGTITTKRDRQKVEELWSPADKMWFPEGKDDPSIVVMEVVPTYVEYWDHSGVESLKTIFDIGRNFVTGKVPDVEERIHQKLLFS
jgi:general stress protein 26